MKIQTVTLLLTALVVLGCADPDRLPLFKGRWQSRCAVEDSPVLGEKAYVRKQVVFPSYDMSRADLSLTRFEDAFCNVPLYTIETGLSLDFLADRVSEGPFSGRKRVNVEVVDSGLSSITFHQNVALQTLDKRSAEFGEKLELHKRLPLSLLGELNRVQTSKLLLDASLQTHVDGEGENILKLGIDTFPFFRPELQGDAHAALVEETIFYRE